MGGKNPQLTRQFLMPKWLRGDSNGFVNRRGNPTRVRVSLSAPMPCSVTAARRSLKAKFMVRIHVGQPLNVE